MAHTPRNESEKATLAARRAWCYLVLVFFSFLCLFFFYILVINSTRTHFEIQKGFSLLPGKSLVTNFKNVLADANIPVLTGIRNSLIVSACSAALSVYFSALTAYGMSKDFDMVALETVTNQYLGGDSSLACSAQTQREIDQKVVELVKAEHAKAIRILTDNRAKLDELAKYLYEKETITGEEFMNILNREDESAAPAEEKIKE